MSNKWVTLDPHKGPWKPGKTSRKQSFSTCNKQCDSDFASFHLQLIKGKPAIKHRRLRYGDACQRFTLCKCMVPNGLHRLRNSDAFQGLAISKGLNPNNCHWLGDCDARQRLTLCKCMVPNGRHRLRDSDAFQQLAISKGRSPIMTDSGIVMLAKDLQSSKA